MGAVARHALAHQFALCISQVEIIGSHGADAADFPAILQLVAEGKLRPQERRVADAALL